MWPFRKKPEPPAPPSPPIDQRIWNEDWCVGDTAECVTHFESWNPSTLPWHRPALGQRLTVVGFMEGTCCGGKYQQYFLRLQGWPVPLSCVAFRKVRPVSIEQPNVVTRILNARPGPDKVKEPLG